MTFAEKETPKFQSTRPARGATYAPLDLKTDKFISIHAPREGRDQKLLLEKRAGIDISIHAPREGRDLRPALRVN